MLQPVVDLHWVQFTMSWVTTSTRLQRARYSSPKSLTAITAMLRSSVQITWSFQKHYVTLEKFKNLHVL